MPGIGLTGFIVGDLVGKNHEPLPSAELEGLAGAWKWPQPDKMKWNK
jgi:hypothetical protein